MSASGRFMRRHSSGDILREYWKHTRPSKWLLVAIAVGIFLDGVLQAGLVGYLKVVIDALVADPAAFVREDLVSYMLLGLGAAVVFFPCAYVAHIACAVLSCRLGASFRIALYRHLQKLSMSFYSERRGGEITARLTGDIDNGVGSMVGTVTHSVWSFAVLVTALMSMLVISWKLTVVFAVLNVFYLATARVCLPYMRTLSRTVRDQTGELTASATEDIAAVTVVKAFAREELFFDRFQTLQDRLYNTQVRLSLLNSAYSDILQVLGKFVAPVGILGTGAYLVDREGLTIGALMAFWTYWGMVQGPLNCLYGVMASFSNSMASMDRVMDFFERAPSPKDKAGAQELRATHGRIEFRDVHFAYPSAKPHPVLRGVSFAIEPNTSLGIVGPSGAGKSTLVQLALRFYDPDRGGITYDGVDLRDVTQTSLRRNTGVVLQESFLLSGTIGDNLRLGNEAATEAQMWEALEQAGAAAFVRGFAKGLDTEVGERGSTLSGGQRQRLCIARVFLRNPRFVIFDEATSALDTATEALIQESMKRLLAGRTSIIIAHRLSTIVACDNILMLADGARIGLAPHGELLRTCPAYADLVAKQALGRPVHAGAEAAPVGRDA